MNHPKTAAPVIEMTDLIPFTFLYTAIGGGILLLRIWPPELPWWESLLKPMIMLSLLVFSWWKGNQLPSPARWWLTTGILASLSGDICLMFAGDLWFVAGLGSFLFAHICYIVLFHTVHRHPRQPSLLRMRPWYALPWLLYGAGLLWLLIPYAGSLTIPIVVYACIILLMALAALNRWEKVSATSFAHVFLGAQLFVISDSLIAAGKFLAATFPIPYLPAWVMLTYIIAQYLIVIGLLIERRAEPTF